MPGMKQCMLWTVFAVFISNPAFGQPKPPRDLCAAVPGAICLAAAPSPVKKLNPGHYMAPYTGEKREGMLRRVDEVCKEPALKGIEMRVRWSTLEPAPHLYDFSYVEEIYNRLAACRKRLIIEVWAVSFSASQSSGLLPPDLEPDALASTHLGWIAKLWDKRVMDRLIAVYLALAKRFDKEPYFEGIIFTETATGAVDDASGYTAAAFIAQLERALRIIRPAWPSTTVLLFNNYLRDSTTQQFVDFVATLDKLGVGIGGPDVLPPPHPNTKGEQIYRGEIGGVDYRGRMLAGFSVQTPELGGREGTFTPQQLYDHCVKTNRCKYMFWVRNTTHGGPEQQWSTGLLPFIRANPVIK